MEQLTVRQTADILKRSVRQVYRWEAKGVLHGTIDATGHRYYEKAEVDIIRVLLQGLTMEEAAQRIGVSVPTLWDWAKHPKDDVITPSYQFCGKSYYSMLDVDNYIQQRTKGVC